MIFTKIFSIYMIVAAIGILLNKQIATKMIQQFKDNYALIYTIGAMATLLGSYMVITHNEWSTIENGLISLISWGILIKGITAMISPNLLMNVAEKIQTPKQMTAWALLPLILGLYLGYIGFLA